MARFHDVNIYLGTRLVTSSSRLEVSVGSSFLQEVLTSIRLCDGCKEPTTLIFPAEDETQNTLQEMFKSLNFPVIYGEFLCLNLTETNIHSILLDTDDIIINDIRSTREIESFECPGEGRALNNLD